jgi:glycosyltransferase involved in cell wall biosynthesis
MKLSIVTVCYNAAATIEDTLRSVAAQTHRDVEHIVVDGASRDATLEIVGRYRAGIARLVSEPDRGLYDAMNKGIALATGEVVGMLNADDIYADEHVLARIARCFEDPAVDACYGDLVYVAREEPRRVVRYWKSCSYRDGLFEKGWIPAHPTFFVRRRVYRQCGGFDLDYRLQSDFELALRLLAVHRIRSVYIPEILVRMRMGGVSNRRLTTILRGNLEAYRACRRHGLAVTPWFMARKILSRLPQFFTRPLG